MDFGLCVWAKLFNSDALVLIDNTAGDNNENNIQVNISDVDGAIGEHEKKRKIWV